MTLTDHANTHLTNFCRTIFLATSEHTQYIIWVSLFLYIDLTDVYLMLVGTFSAFCNWSSSSALLYLFIRNGFNATRIIVIDCCLLFFAKIIFTRVLLQVSVDALRMWLHFLSQWFLNLDDYGLDRVMTSFIEIFLRFEHGFKRSHLGRSTVITRCLKPILCFDWINWVGMASGPLLTISFLSLDWLKCSQVLPSSLRKAWYAN